VPAIIADLGDQAGWRYVDFFTANIRNPNTRRAYARGCSQFFAWCEQRGLTVTAIRPHDVASYIERLEMEASAPLVKQQLAASGCCSTGSSSAKSSLPTNSLTTYTFGTGAAQHTFCSHCGMHAFYVPRSQPDRITANARCLDDIDGPSLKPLDSSTAVTGRNLSADGFPKADTSPLPD
jgi:hypothetical protein